MATLSQNITQAISDFDDIKTAIQAKGVTVASGTPTSDYDSLIASIPSGDDNLLKGIIQRTATALNIPNGTTIIGTYAFYHGSTLDSVVIPDSVVTIDKYAFAACSHISTLTIGSGVRTIEESAFQSAFSLSHIVIPGTVQTIGKNAITGNEFLESITVQNGVTTLGNGAFKNNTRLNTVYLPNSITSIGTQIFYLASYLNNVTLENGFNASGLDFSVSTRYTADRIVGWLNALADRTGETAYTLTIGANNIAKLTNEQIAIATNKNWNLA